MQQMNAKLLMIGMLAGVTAALLALGAMMQPSFASVLYAASALPVLIVGLGFGNLAAVAAILTAAIVGAISVSPMFAGTMAIFTLLPAGWISHLANLARPASELGGPDGLLAWYPLSDILFHLCGIIAVAVVIMGWMIGYGPEMISQLTDAVATSFNQQPSAGMQLDTAALQQSQHLLLMLLPVMQGGMWVLMLFAVYYIATRVVGASGHSLRPREDMPSALRMNRNSVFVFLGGILLTFSSGVPAMVGATVCGTFGAGFLLSGFASLHLRSRGKDWRLPVLLLSYIASLFVLPAMLILFLGVADSRRTVALTPAAKASETTDNNDNT